MVDIQLTTSVDGLSIKSNKLYHLKGDLITFPMMYEYFNNLDYFSNLDY